MRNAGIPNKFWWIEYEFKELKFAKMLMIKMFDVTIEHLVPSLIITVV